MSRVRGYLLGVTTAVSSVMIGLYVMWTLDAPRSYLILNIAGVAIGALAGALVLAARPTASRGLVLAALVGGAAVVLTALFGVSLDGVRRWAKLGPLLVHVGLVAMPFVLMASVQSRSHLGGIAICLALIGTALQPDAALASALAAGLLALALTTPRSMTGWAMGGLGVAAAAGCWMQPDALPSVRLVEHLIPLAFAHSATLGTLAVFGVSLPALALFVFAVRPGPARSAAFTLGSAWSAVIIAALVGNYPTPMIGYGFSPIIAYLLCWSLISGTPEKPRQAAAKYRAITRA